MNARDVTGDSTRGNLVYVVGDAKACMPAYASLAYALPMTQ
jgi:hypothetical protein